MTSPPATIAAQLTVTVLSYLPQAACRIYNESEDSLIFIVQSPISSLDIRPNDAHIRVVCP
jgi:hypothetical protein